MIKLYDMAANSNSRKIRAVARECDAAFEIVPTDLRKGDGQTPEFKAINPNGKIPAMTDGDVKMFESNAIMCYVAAKHKSPLLPADAKGRGQVDQWLFWQTAHLADAVGTIAWERVYKTMLNMGTPVQANIDEGLANLDRFLGVLDGVLAKNTYVCGAQMTVADYAICGTICKKQQDRMSIAAEVNKFASVKRWLGVVEARPAWNHGEEA